MDEIEDHIKQHTIKNTSSADNFKYQIFQDNQGNYIAYRFQIPSFYFQDKSRVAVIASVQRAIKFYQEGKKNGS